MNIITIHWARHAESCSNYDGENYQDKNTDRPLGFNINQIGVNINQKFTSIKPQSHQIINNNTDIFTPIKAKFKYHPNLSYIGMQHAIILGRDFIRPQNLLKKYDAVFSSATIRSIMTALLAFRGQPNTIIYVVPYINEISNFAGIADMDYQNTPYKSEILKRQIAFIKEWLRYNWISKFDDIEIMQNLIQLRELLTIEQKDLINIIDEILSCKNKFGTLDYGSIDMAKYNQCFENNTLIHIQIICDKLSDTTNPDVKKIITFLKSTQSIDFITGPDVDFSILEEFERYHELQEKNNDPYMIHQNLRQPNMLKFYNNVLPYVYTQNILKGTNNKIFCVSHGSLLKTFFPKYYPIEKQIANTDNYIKHLQNTQVFEEKFLFRFRPKNKPPKPPIIEQISIQFNKYIPLAIRTNYENFELFNTDICRIESIKGILNYSLVDNNLSHKLVPTKLSVSEFFGVDKKTQPENVVADDVKFFFDDKIKPPQIYDKLPLNSNTNSNKLIGGYHRKYLKYKLKYQEMLIEKN